MLIAFTLLTEEVKRLLLRTRTLTPSHMGFPTLYTPKNVWYAAVMICCDDLL